MRRQSRHGESQVFIVFGMLVMLVLGVVLDRVALLRVFPSASVQSNQSVTKTKTASPWVGTAQTFKPTTTTPAGNTYSPPQPSYTGSSNATISKGLLIASGPTVIGTGGTRTISGTIHNTSGKGLAMVRVTFATYDAVGNKLGEAYDVVDNLGVNETWKFEALMGSDVRAYRLEDLSSW